LLSFANSATPGEFLSAQTSLGSAKQSNPAHSNWLLLCFLGVAAAVFWFIHRGDIAGWWLEDLPVYAQAVRTWMAGSTPYDDSLSPLFFLYPPAFLYLAGGLSRLFPSGWGEGAYVALEIVATLALPLVLARYYFRQLWLSPLFAILLFFASPRFTGALALCSMNIASVLYCAAFLAAVPGLRRNRWMWFYGAVFLAAIIKITFLALLLLPLLVGRRQWLRSVACGVAVVAVNLLEKVFVSALYDGYQWSLKQGILAQQQFGYGIFGIVASYHYKQRGGPGLAAYAAAGVTALVVLGLMFLLRRRLERNAVDLSGNAHWLALVVVSIVLVNPREMQYDIDIALFAGFVLWVYALRTRRILVLMTAFFLPSLAVPLVVLNPHLHGIYETLLVLAGFGMGYWRLWTESRSRTGQPVLHASLSGAA
jgi:hypothetical protein